VPTNWSFIAFFWAAATPGIPMRQAAIAIGTKKIAYLCNRFSLAAVVNQIGR
jgi:hypothetical protein